MSGTSEGILEPVVWPGHERWQTSSKLNTVNGWLARLRFPFELIPRFRYERGMVCPEQVSNFELLLFGLFFRKVPGELVELGCYSGGGGRGHRVNGPTI